jgi:hypothetical protein
VKDEDDMPPPPPDELPGPPEVVQEQSADEIATVSNTICVMSHSLVQLVAIHGELESITLGPLKQQGDEDRLVRAKVRRSACMCLASQPDPQYDMLRAVDSLRAECECMADTLDVRMHGATAPRLPHPTAGGCGIEAGQSARARTEH